MCACVSTISRVPLVLIVTVPILLLWLPMSRVSQIRWLVALVIASLTALGAMLVHFLPRGLLEITLSCLTLVLVTVLAARLIERRRLGPGSRARVVVPTHLLAGWVLVALLCGAVVWRPGGFFPSTGGVLPLPDGLSAGVQPYDDRDCGSGACARTITVTGRPGQSGEDLYTEVKGHVNARGWGRECRPVGWLLDRRAECIELTLKGDQVEIVLWGVRDYPGI
jgi:hypothetical protein